MESTRYTSSYDVIVVKNKNQSFKSTPFQIVFSQKSVKLRQGKKIKGTDQIKFYVNDQLIDIPLKIDQSGRVHFKIKYIKKLVNMSDSSDISDDDQMSQRSTSRQKRMSSSLKGQSIEQLKNQHAPKTFWEKAWFFQKKNEQHKIIKKQPQSINEEEESRLAKIKQEPYQGQQSSKQPLFQLSLCGHLLAKNRQKQISKEEQQIIFYKNKIQYKNFIKDPLTIINDDNLIVRIDNSLYTWQLGVAILVCKYAFGVEPQNQFIDEIIKNKSKKRWFPMFGGKDNMTKVNIEKQPPVMQPPTKLQDQQIVKFKKTPDSDMISKMKLKYGQNKAKIVIQTLPGVQQQTQFLIFLWDQNQKVIISDVDGTITRSDVMGQIKTNYIHKGVCVLYNEIYKRNYKLLYMTARAINQYGQTRRFLQKQVEQNGLRLPSGPLLMSPDGYIKSFTRQVIEKTPDQLKIKLLATVNQIFPSTKKPIIAGFGNRETDSIAYLRIKIPHQKIFCISEKSIITNEDNKQFSSSYPQMFDNIQDFFPMYVKPQYSDSKEEIGSSSKDKNPLTAQDNEEQMQLQYRRKMSHNQIPLFQNEYYQYSKARSEQGYPKDNNADFQLIIQEFESNNNKSVEDKFN